MSVIGWLPARELRPLLREDTSRPALAHALLV
jgi:hypothetical protein